MRRTITYSAVYTYTWCIIIAMAIFMNFAFADAAKVSHGDTTYLRASSKAKSAKNSYIKNGLHLVLPPLKPAVTSSVKVSVSRPDDKLLSDVQVYPNPVTEQQMNVKYSVTRNANVTIIIKDVLGNDITTLFSQRVESGDHTLSYAINNKLTRGFYFVRVVAGTESVIKRIMIF